MATFDIDIIYMHSYTFYNEALHQLDNPLESYGHFSRTKMVAGHYLGFLETESFTVRSATPSPQKTHPRTTSCLKKCTKFETVQLKIIRIDFDVIWQKYSKYSRVEFICFSFHVGLLVVTLSSLKLHTENNTFLLEIVGGSEKSGLFAGWL